MKGHHSQRQPQIVEDVDSDNDEEIPEDEAFNSEDERRYGSFFENNKHQAESDSSSNNNSGDSEEDSDTEDEDGIASDDDDSEGDGGQFMLDLLNRLDGPSEQENGDKKASVQLATNVKESEFSSSVVRRTDLTLDSLMKGLKDTKGFGVMQKTMKDVSKREATSAPVSRKLSDRAERKVHYEHQSEEVSHWIGSVKQNREAETLDFRPKDRMKVTRDGLVEKFVPTTIFELEVAAALEKAGQLDEDAILNKEKALLQAEDDLGSSKLTMEEYKKRRGELAKIRALMFYHEQKRHHINKIKSKKYRRIRKKQRARQKEAELSAQMEDDPELVRDMEEKEEVERMKERMTLAHKNTSKWARRILKRGKNVDVDTRRALSAQLKRGDDLRKKMVSASGEGADDTEEDDDNLADAARQVLADAETDDSHDPVNGTGLFQLSFMKRGIEKQRERAKEEARQLLRELQDTDGPDEEALENHDDECDSNLRTPAKAKIASKEEMRKVIADGTLVASSLEFGNSNSISVSGGIDVSLPGEDVQHPGGGQPAQKAIVSYHEDILSVPNKERSVSSPAKSRRDISSGSNAGRMKSALIANSEPEEDECKNPWMTALEKKDSLASKKKQESQVSSNTQIVDVAGAAALDNEPSRTLDTPSAQVDEEDSERKEGGIDAESTAITSLSQDQLVRMAFATSEETEIMEEFSKEKERLTERDDPTRKKEEASKSVSGWGSWAGEGAPAPRPPRKLPKRLKAPPKKLCKRKRQDEKKPLVIINEKRLKRTANNFQIAHIPYPYKSREEYERAMTGGVGSEWNVTGAVKNLTRPEIYTRAGKVIQPMSKKAKVKRAPAKF